MRFYEQQTGIVGEVNTEFSIEHTCLRLARTLDLWLGMARFNRRGTAEEFIPKLHVSIRVKNRASLEK